MKKNLLYTVLLFASAIASVGCNDDPEEGSKLPTIEMKTEQVSHNSVTFTIKANDAVKLAYVVLEKGNEIPTAEQIINTGTEISNHTESTLTVDNLKAETNYNVICAASCRCGKYVSREFSVMTLKAPAKQPQVSIENGTVTQSAVSFTIHSSDAMKGAYVVVKEGEQLPSADELLASGKAFEVNQKASITEEGLKEGVSYTIMAAVAGEENLKSTAQSIIQTAKAPSLEFDPTRGSAKIYGTKNVCITLRTLFEGVDYELQLDIYDHQYAQNKHLSPRTYNVASGTNDGSVSSDTSYLQMGNDQFKLQSGTLEVQIREKKYNLTVKLVLNNGKTFNASFVGELDGMPIN